MRFVRPVAAAIAVAFLAVGLTAPQASAMRDTSWGYSIPNDTSWGYSKPTDTSWGYSKPNDTSWGYSTGK